MPTRLDKFVGTGRLQAISDLRTAADPVPEFLKRVFEFTDRNRDRVPRDVVAIPSLGDQPFAGNPLASVLNKRPQNVKRLRPQLRGYAVPQHTGCSLCRPGKARIRIVRLWQAPVRFPRPVLQFIYNWSRNGICGFPNFIAGRDGRCSPNDSRRLPRSAEIPPAVQWTASPRAAPSSTAPLGLSDRPP